MLWFHINLSIHLKLTFRYGQYMYICTTVACLPSIRDLEKCRVIGHNPHFSSLCSVSCLNPNVLPKGIKQECSARLFSACDWWKALYIGTSHIDSSEAVVYVIYPRCYEAQPSNPEGSIYHERSIEGSIPRGLSITPWGVSITNK